MLVEPTMSVNSIVASIRSYAWGTAIEPMLPAMSRITAGSSPTTQASWPGAISAMSIGWSTTSSPSSIWIGELPGQEHLDVMHGTRSRAHERAHVGRPAPAGYNTPRPSRWVPTLARSSVGELRFAVLIRMQETLPLDAGHRRD